MAAKKGKSKKAKKGKAKRSVKAATSAGAQTSSVDPSESAMRLIHLVHDLMRDPNLRIRFNENFEKVIADYQLDDDEQNALYAMNPDTAAEAVSQQILDFPFPDEFPPCSEEYTPEDGSSEYPSPEPIVFRVRPKKAKLTDLGESVELIVTGQSFGPSNAVSVKVKELGSSAKPWKVESHRFGTFRCSRLQVIMTPSGSKFKVGKYKILVYTKGLDDPIFRGKPDDPDFEIE